MYLLSIKNGIQEEAFERENEIQEDPNKEMERKLIVSIVNDLTYFSKILAFLQVNLSIS